MKTQIIAVLGFLLLVLATGQTSGATPRFYDVEMNHDTRLKSISEVQNIANESKEPFKTTISEWQSHLEDKMPNGTFQGGFFTGSKFHNFYTPSWEEIRNVSDPTYYDFGEVLGEARYSYVLIASHFNWSSSVIMNGASEWWVRLPISPQSIEVAHGLILAVFKDKTNASEVYLERSWDAAPLEEYNLDGNWRVSPIMMRPSIDGYMPQDYIQYRFNGTEGDAVYQPFLWDLTTPFESGVGLVRNDRIYLKVNSIIRSDTDYVLALVYRLPSSLSGAQGLYTYWSGMTNLSRDTHFQIYEFQQIWNTPHFGQVQWWDVSEVDNVSLDREMDMDWSFIFTEGIGYNGLFGKKITFGCNGTLTLYPFVNTSRSGTQHMSFMFPFIGGGNYTIEPEIHQARYFPPYTPTHMWTFSDGLPYFDPDIWYNYTDFVLFSSSGTINFTGAYNFNDYDRWNVRLRLNFIYDADFLAFNRTDDFELTMLCYARDRPAKLWTDFVESSPYSFNSSWSPVIRPYLQTSLDNGMIFNEYFYYEIFCSGRGTDDQWAMYVGTYSGRKLYTYHFPQIIWINPMQWKLSAPGGEYVINMTQKDGYYQRVQDWWGEHYFGDMIKYQWYDPVKNERVGEITDFIGQYLDAMRRLGEWIYVIGTAFVGQLWEFIQEALDAVVALALSIAPLVAPLIFVAVVTLAARSAKNPLEEDKSCIETQPW